MDENQQYYEAIIDMTSTEGWRYFVEDVNTSIEAITDLRNIHSLETLFYVKGQLEILERFKNYRTGIENSYEDFQRDKANAYDV